MDYSLPGSSVHEILQARILEWVAIPFVRGSQTPNISLPPLFPFNHQFSCSVMFDSLRPHGMQYARLPCRSPAPRACSNSYPSSWWCHPTISSPLINLKKKQASKQKGTDLELGRVHWLLRWTQFNQSVVRLLRGSPPPPKSEIELLRRAVSWQQAIGDSPTTAEFWNQPEGVRKHSLLKPWKRNTSLLTSGFWPSKTQIHLSSLDFWPVGSVS